MTIINTLKWTEDDKLYARRMGWDLFWRDDYDLLHIQALDDPEGVLWECYQEEYAGPDYYQVAAALGVDHDALALLEVARMADSKVRGDVIGPQVETCWKALRMHGCPGAWFSTEDPYEVEID